MNYNLLKPLEESVDYRRVAETVKAKKNIIALHGLTDSQKAHIIAAIHCDTNKQICVLTYNEIEAKKTFQDLRFYLGDKVSLFQSKEVMYYDVETAGKSQENERSSTLERIINNGNGVIVAPIGALLLRLSPPQIFCKYSLAFKVGEEINLSETIENLVIQGYTRTEKVEKIGDFSIRGAIVDIFPASTECPVRIELFDSEVDSIRYFHVETQKSIKKINKTSIFPVSEIILEPSKIKEGIKAILVELYKTKLKHSSEVKTKLEKKTAQKIEKLEQMKQFRGVDLYMPYIYKERISLIDYLKPDALIFLDEPSRIKDKTDVAITEFNENFKTLLERGEVLPKQSERILTYNELVNSIREHTIITMTLLTKQNLDFPPTEITNFVTRDVQPFHGKIDLLGEELKLFLKRGYKVVLLPGTEDKAKRLEDVLKDREINASFLRTSDENLEDKQIAIVKGSIQKGFEYVNSKFVLISDFEIYGVHKQKKNKRKREDTRAIANYSELKTGDFVVHESHGIGKYAGIQELSVKGIKKDYLKIRYSGADNLYVPTDQMDLIQKYIGSEAAQPKLNKMGGAEWVRTKTRVKKAIEDMTEDLLRLYAEREKNIGHAFEADTDWQRQFEALFPYEETLDQLISIEEVKKDMEKSRVMDRLLCGDVGYGKTEVAIRAAFKAVMSNKQVAVLVPTTILAQQHYNSFVQRFSGFPVNIEMLSRFRTLTQQKMILKTVKQGNIDIIIGTHRLLSKDVEFNDLGLVVVDEEQRFGVKHKEALKTLKQSVDVLTLTATPIPRTLHMSMVGIRDMSTIEDPPEERLPIQTYVIAHNENIIEDAITREIVRNGQIYYVYNRVQGIHKIANRLAKLVPQAKIAVAHGQMGERHLEKLMLDYYKGDFDILVCTTIIETGLDISNVNTIIIHDADKLGLSQLYQLRGRVGRTNRQAYAYLTYEKNKVLTEIAEKRLKAIKEFTEFGSGFKIAMRDLEIRGAGNLLGGEQHGHMSSIGYDLYVKMISEAVSKLKGEKQEIVIETTIELSVDAYIPEKYINDQNQKIEVYKKIAAIRNLENMYEIEEEIEDRFGDIPVSVRNLLLISYTKAMARNANVISISQREKYVNIAFGDGLSKNLENISDVLRIYKKRVVFHATKNPHLVYEIKEKDQYKFLQDLKDVVEILVV
ncbi:MAG: transcription-repair coupling factor [Alkaliphilus sp.]